MKIVMAAACPYPTTQGTQVYIRGMVRALVGRGHDVHVVAYHFGEELPSEGETLHRTPRAPGYAKLRAGPAWAKPVLDAMLVGTLLRVARTVRPDLLIAHNYEAPIAAYVVRALTGIPVLYNSHNLMQDELHRYFEHPAARSAARRLAGVLDRQVPRRADRVMVISRAAVEAHRGLGVRPDRIEHLPPAVHPEDFGEPVVARASRPTVVYAGNPDRYQDLEILVEAFAQVVPRVPTARLVFVSSAALGYVQGLVRDAGLGPEHVELMTETRWDVVRATIASSWVAALPRTVCRGFPIKLLNYFGCARPVVACIGSALLGVDGVTGRIVPNGAVSQFADALVELLEDPDRCDRMGAAARASLLAEHRWERRVGLLEAICARTVAGG